MKVFVYGSLLANEYNHRQYLQGQSFVDQAILPGYALYDLGSFPGIIDDPDEKVRGEVYDVDNITLERLDSLEGNGQIYTRRLIEAMTSDDIIAAYVYVWNGQVQQQRKIDFAEQPWTVYGKARSEQNV